MSPPTQASALGHSYTIEEANNNPSTRCWRWRTVVGVGGGRRRVSRRTEERNAGRRSIVNRTAARGSRQNPRKKHPIPYSSAKRHGAQPRSRSADPAGRVPGLHTNGDHAVFSYVARSAVRDGMLEGFKLPRHTRTRFVRQARLGGTQQKERRAFFFPSKRLLLKSREQNACGDHEARLREGGERGFARTTRQLD